MKSINFNSLTGKISNLIKDLIKYYDLGFILDNLESIIILPIPYKNSSVSTDEYDNNKELAMAILANFENTFSAFKNELDMRKTTFDAIKKQYPDFCQNMNKKMEPQIYQEYLELLKDCSKNISNLIADFKHRKNDYKDLLLTRKDDISNIIDTESNSRLTCIQDNFVLQELNSFDYSNMDPEIQENIKRIKEELENRIEKYHTFQRIYSSKNIIRLDIKTNSLHNDAEERD